VADVVPLIEKCAKQKDWALRFNNVLGGTYKDEKGYVTIGLERNEHDIVVTSQADAEARFGPFRKWEDESVRTINAIKDRFNELFIVDGWVYELVGEPVIEIYGDHERDQLSLRVVQERDPVSNYRAIYDDRSASGYPRFGLDELERAREIAQVIASEKGAPFEEALNIELVSPWEVRFRGESEFILNISERVLKFGKEHLGELDGNFGLAWHDLASSLYVRDSVTPRLIDALQRMAAMGSAMFKRNEKGQIGKSWLSDNEEGLADSIAFAMNLWESRNHRGFEWTDKALCKASTFSDSGFAYEITSLTQASMFAENLGVPLTKFDELTTEAAGGRGHLIGIADGNGPLAAIFVIEGDDGPEAVKWVTKHGSSPSAKIAELACLHAQTADVSNADLAADLTACGI